MSVSRFVGLLMIGLFLMVGTSQSLSVGGAVVAQSVDDDGDGFSNEAEAGTLLCFNNSTPNDDSPDDSVANDGCPAIGEAETICTGNGDDDGDRAANDGCPQVGAFSEAQFNIGTDPLVRCGEGAEAGPSAAWPSDLASGSVVLDSTDKIDVLDIVSFLAPVKRLGAKPADAAFDSRWDLVPGITLPFANFIELNDLTQLLVGPASTPPMFGGAKVFNGPSCTD